MFKTIGVHFVRGKKNVSMVELGIKLLTELAVIFALCRMERLHRTGVWQLHCLVRLDVIVF